MFPCTNSPLRTTTLTSSRLEIFPWKSLSVKKTNTNAFHTKSRKVFQWLWSFFYDYWNCTTISFHSTKLYIMSFYWKFEIVPATITVMLTKKQRLINLSTTSLNLHHSKTENNIIHSWIGKNTNVNYSANDSSKSANYCLSYNWKPQ